MKRRDGIVPALSSPALNSKLCLEWQQWHMTAGDTWGLKDMWAQKIQGPWWDYWAADQLPTTTYTWVFCCMRKTIPWASRPLSADNVYLYLNTFLLICQHFQLEHACGMKLLPQAQLSTTAHFKYSTSPVSLSKVLIPVLRIWGSQLQWGAHAWLIICVREQNPMAH